MTMADACKVTTRRDSIEMKTTVALVLLTILSSAHADTVYRCGNAYQDKPCAGAIVIDAQPSKGMEVRTSAGSVVHSHEGDKARGARTVETMNENSRNALKCGRAGQAPKVQGGYVDCGAAKAERDAKRLTPDLIKKAD